MESRLLNSQSFEFVKAKWTGENESGCIPIGEYILVLIDEATDTSKGGIIITPDILEKRQMAAETGIIAEIGDGAFFWNSERSREFVGRKPKVGDHILFARYAGRIVNGNDGKQYRIMMDKEVGGIAIDEGWNGAALTDDQIS